VPWGIRRDAWVIPHPHHPRPLSLRTQEMKAVPRTYSTAMHRGVQDIRPRNTKMCEVLACASSAVSGASDG
jgi:hypothetical protein